MKQELPAHEEEDEGDDAEDDDDHGQACEHCRSSESMKYVWSNVMIILIITMTRC